MSDSRVLLRSAEVLDLAHALNDEQRAEEVHRVASQRTGAVLFDILKRANRQDEVSKTWRTTVDGDNVYLVADEDATDKKPDPKKRRQK